MEGGIYYLIGSLQLAGESGRAEIMDQIQGLLIPQGGPLEQPPPDVCQVLVRLSVESPFKDVRTRMASLIAQLKEVR